MGLLSGFEREDKQSRAGNRERNGGGCMWKDASITVVHEGMDTFVYHQVTIKIVDFGAWTIEAAWKKGFR